LISYQDRSTSDEIDATDVYSSVSRHQRVGGVWATADHPCDDGQEGQEGCASREGEWISTACQGCTQWCAVQIYVEDGRAVRVRGNPLNKTNLGYCCPRGHLIPQQTYDPDRIKVPMKRTNPVKGRGVDPKWVPISWDEALDTVADKMIELRKANEPNKFVYLRGRYSSTGTQLLYGALPRIYGSTNYFSHSAICAEAEKMGPGLTQGFFGYRDYDLANTNCLVAWGCDPLASNRLVPNTIAQFGSVLARGRVIAVDPRLSNVAAKAHEWLPIKPGTDGALAGAIAHVMLTEGLWNREFVGDFKDGKNLFVAGQTVDEAAFVEKETHGLVKWWNLELKDRTPEWAERETLIPALQIVRVAQAIGAAAPKVAVWMGPGVGMNPRGTYASMAVYALNALAGSIDVEGGTLQSSSVPVAAFPKSDAYLDDLAKAASKGKKLDGRGAKDMPAMMNARPGSGVVTNYVATAMLKDPGAVKVLLASWNNLNFSCTDPTRWDKALAAVPFFAHMVTNASEMTQFADVVLPSTFNSSEGMSVVTDMGNTYGYATIQQPAGKRLWDVKQEETEVVWLLAQKLRDKGFPESLRLLGEGVQGSGNRQIADQRDGVHRNCRQDLQRAVVDAERAAERRQARRLGGLSQERHLRRPEVQLQERLGRQVQHADEEVRVLQRGVEERSW
jgi:anaerobic selenocysteine-containing dehydrogenase